MFFQTRLYDINRIHPKKKPFDYFDYLRNAPSIDYGKSSSIIQLLRTQKNNPIGFSFNPAEDHHFCDYLERMQFFDYGTFVQGIHVPEAIWIKKQG